MKHWNKEWRHQALKGSVPQDAFHHLMLLGTCLASFSPCAARCLSLTEQEWRCRQLEAVPTSQAQKKTDSCSYHLCYQVEGKISIYRYIDKYQMSVPYTNLHRRNKLSSENWSQQKWSIVEHIYESRFLACNSQDIQSILLSTLPFINQSYNSTKQITVPLFYKEGQWGR